MLQKTQAFILLQITLHNLHLLEQIYHKLNPLGHINNFRKTMACILMVIFFLDFAKVVAEMDVLVKEAEAVFNANFVASLDMILLHVNSPRACA
jgi:hypothetical protein